MDQKTLLSQPKRDWLFTGSIANAVLIVCELLACQFSIYLIVAIIFFNPYFFFHQCSHLPFSLFSDWSYLKCLFISNNVKSNQLLVLLILHVIAGAGFFDLLTHKLEQKEQKKGKVDDLPWYWSFLVGYIVIGMDIIFGIVSFMFGMLHRINPIWIVFVFVLILVFYLLRERSSVKITEFILNEIRRKMAYKPFLVKTKSDRVEHFLEILKIAHDEKEQFTKSKSKITEFSLSVKYDYEPDEPYIIITPDLEIEFKKAINFQIDLAELIDELEDNLFGGHLSFAKSKRAIQYSDGIGSFARLMILPDSINLNNCRRFSELAKKALFDLSKGEYKKRVHLYRLIFEEVFPLEIQTKTESIYYDMNDYREVNESLDSSLVNESQLHVPEKSATNVHEYTFLDLFALALKSIVLSPLSLTILQFHRTNNLDELSNNLYFSFFMLSILIIGYMSLSQYFILFFVCINLLIAYYFLYRQIVSTTYTPKKNVKITYLLAMLMTTIYLFVSVLLIS